MSQDLILEEVHVLEEWVDEFARVSEAEGHNHMNRLRRHYLSGDNRFARTGELLLLARVGGMPVGVCGLNRDPFAESSGDGRVRHLYVLPGYRRRGVARALLLALMGHARGSFDRLRVRTDTAAAESFYLSLGFTGCIEPYATHVYAMPSEKAA